MYGYGGTGRDFTMSFVGCCSATGLNFDGRESGIFHVHIGMAGYGNYVFAGSQTIIGIVMDHGTYYSQVD